MCKGNYCEGGISLQYLWFWACLGTFHPGSKPFARFKSGAKWNPKMQENNQQQDLQWEYFLRWRFNKVFNYLRKEGGGAVEAYINGENNSFKSVSSLAAIKQNSKKGKERTARTKMKQVVKNDRMRADKMFLKNLEKTIKPLSGMRKDPVRWNYRYFWQLINIRNPSDNVHKAADQMMDFLNTREEFWKQIDWVELTYDIYTT